MIYPQLVVREEQIWRDPKTGRRVRVVSLQANMDKSYTSKVGVRNCESGRLSYLPLGRFRHWLVCESESEVSGGRRP